MFLKHNLAAFVWTLFIFILCVLPGSAIPHYKWTDLLSIDKAVHTFLFAVLVLLFIRGFKRQTRFSFIQKNAFMIILVFAVTYGGLLELVQNYFLTDRTGSWFDWIADTFGCVAGFAINNSLKKKELHFFGFGI